MIVLTRWFTTLVLPLLATVAYPAEVDVVFTNPNCQAKDYLVVTTDMKGDAVSQTSGHYYCDSADFSDWDFSESPLARRLSSSLIGETVSEVSLVDYYLTEPSFARWICELDFTSDAIISIYYQHTTDSIGHMSREFAEGLAACSREVRFFDAGCDRFSDGNKCKGGNLNIIHATVFAISTVSGRHVALLGSGNINKSLYANLEDWIVIDSSDVMTVDYRYKCIFQALDRIVGLRYPPLQYFRTAYRECVSSWGAGNAPGLLRFAVLPEDEDWLRQQLREAIEKASEIDIAVQFLTDPEIIEALKSSDATIRVVLDDDYYWGLIGSSFGVVSKEEAVLIQGLLARDNVDYRFLITNHHGESGLTNTNHLRFIRTRGHRSAVFTGSAHLRAGSLANNLEVQLIIEHTSTLEKYDAVFHSLFLAGLVRERMLAADVPAK